MIIQPNIKGNFEKNSMGNIDTLEFDSNLQKLMKEKESYLEINSNLKLENESLKAENETLKTELINNTQDKKSKKGGE